MKLKNLEIRTLMEEKRIKDYEVAAVLGISETSFSRMLCRGEIPEEKKEKIITAIESISSVTI